MADRDMYATTDLRPLLADRGVVLSREQVYRLVTRVPERLSLQTLAALCDILLERLNHRQYLVLVRFVAFKRVYSNGVGRMSVAM